MSEEPAPEKPEEAQPATPPALPDGPKYDFSGDFRGALILAGSNAHDSSFRIGNHNAPPPAAEPELVSLVQSYLETLEEQFSRVYDDVKNIIPLSTQPGKVEPSTVSRKAWRHSREKFRANYQPRYSPLPPSTIPEPDESQPEVSIEEFLAAKQHVALLGPPGIGKSTTLRRLVTYYGNAWVKSKSRQGAIPIFAALNQWQEQTQGVIEFLQEQVSRAGAPELANRLPQLLKTEAVVLLLDGLNELPRLKRQKNGEIDDPRSKAIARLNEQDEWREVQVVLTCRVRDFAGGPRWHDLHVLELNRSQVEKLAAAYFENDPEAEKLTHDLLVQLYEQNDQPVARLQGLATQPFYLTKLLVYYDEKKTLPDNPAELLAFTVQEALEREKQAGRITRAEARKLENGLAHLAFNLTEASQVSLEQPQAAAWFFLVPLRARKQKKVKATVEELRQAEHFFQLAEGAGLITRQGNNLQFYHQLFQEYFCARYCQSCWFTAAFLERISHPTFEPIWPVWTGLDPKVEDRLIALVRPTFKNKLMDWIASASSFIDNLLKKNWWLRLFIAFFIALFLEILTKSAIPWYVFGPGYLLFEYALFRLLNLAYFKKPRNAQTALLNLTSAKANLSQQTSFEIKDARFYRGRGNAYYDLQQYERAIEYYTEAIYLDENQLDYYKRGWAYVGLKEYQRAIKDYTKVISLNPNFILAYFGLGYANDSLERYKEAIWHYDKLLSLSPKDAAAYNNRGWAYYKLKQYQRAIEDYYKAFSLNPKDAYVCDNWGLAYNGLKQYEHAITCYQMAISLNPKYAIAYSNRGWAYVKLKQYEQAIHDCNQAIAFDPKLVAAYNNRACAYLKLKQYERAIEDLNKALSITPKGAYLYNNRGEAYADLEQYDQAILDFDQALALDPQFGEAYYHRGNAYYWMGGDREQAERDWQKARELGYIEEED